MNHQDITSESIIHDVLKIATKGISASEKLDEIVSYIGKRMQAERCYIFENILDVVNNTHEWVVEGVEPQIDVLQNIPQFEMQGWYTSFSKREVILIPDVEEIREDEPWIYETLRAQDIHTIAVVALVDNEKVIGFFGVDNPPIDTLSHATQLLESLSYFVVSGIREKKLEARDHGKMLDAMRDTAIYVITQKDHKILYFNDAVKRVSPSVAIGDVCHDIWQGSCERCPLLSIGEEKSCTTINFNDPFGKIVDITATKFLWNNEIPSFIIQVSPHIETVDEKEARRRGLLLETVKDMYYKSILLDLKTGEYESYYQSTQELRFLEQGIFDDLLRDYLYVVDEEYKDSCWNVGNTEALKKYFAQGNRHFEYVYKINTATGYEWIRFVAHVCDSNTEGEATFATILMEEITEYKEKELRIAEELRDALSQAEAANRAKSVFLSNMSHDIRTPMNAIVGYASIAGAHMDQPERVKDCLRKILISGEHLQGLINDVLDMSRIESGKEYVNLAKNSLSELIRNSMTMIQSQVQAKQLEFFVDTINIKDEMVWMDIAKMRQVLVNILSNAVKFTGAGGRIVVRVMQEESEIEGYAKYIFTIKDSGIGMSQEFLKKIFDPFEQEHSSTTSSQIGTGLGMAICKNLVNIMDGTICVESEQGKGSEFTLMFDWKVEKDGAALGRLEQLRGYRALVVDDDFQTCGSVTHMLQEVGMRADWTTTAKEAIFRAQLAHHEGDGYYAYIIDWVMPDMNGIELTRQIRKIIGDEAPIIILTAYYWGDIEKEAREAGVTSFCTKPLFASDLTDVLLMQHKQNHVPVEYQFKGEKILLVEDNMLNVEIAQYILEDLGFEVQVAENGQIAVDMMSTSEENEFRFVLMDVMMPIMDGLEATKTIRRINRSDAKKVPIIALTANAFKDDVDACLAAGMNEHLAKPFKKEDLLKILLKYYK